MPWIVLVRRSFMVCSLWMLCRCINAQSISHRREELEPPGHSGEQISLGRQKTAVLSCCSVLYWCLCYLLSTQLHSRSNRRTELGKRKEGQGWEGKLREEKMEIAEELILWQCLLSGLLILSDV